MNGDDLSKVDPEVLRLVVREFDEFVKGMRRRTEELPNRDLETGWPAVGQHLLEPLNVRLRTLLEAAPATSTREAQKLLDQITQSLQGFAGPSDQPGGIHSEDT